MKHRITYAVCILLLLPLLFGGCASASSSGAYYADNRTFASFDVAGAVGVDFDDILNRNNPLGGEGDAAVPVTPAPSTPNDAAPTSSYNMRVYGKMDIFDRVGATEPINTLSDGTKITLTPVENSIWAEISDAEGALLGYAKEGFLHAISVDGAAYATLPIEYGMAKTNDDTYVEAYSHLVDVREYLRVYEADASDLSLSGVDLTKYDVIVAMQLSTYETTIKQPFYDRNLCLLQYDTIGKFKDAVDAFKKDGYTVIIYDAYRPTSVQQRWFNVVGVHKWVADPSRGMGGVHDRGTAIDMSLIDKNGNLVDMPTAMHTFSDAAARSSSAMSAAQRKNMDYMKDIMVAAGFDFINSEWWHFQDSNTRYYLPSDHPIDEIPLVIARQN